jgi:hypothetical protein
MDIYKDLQLYINDTIHGLKVLLYTHDSDIFERIDFEDHQLYKEPLLFSAVKKDLNYWLDGILLKWLDSPEKTKAYSTSNYSGIIYLPKIGYLKTSHPNSKLEIHQDHSANISIFREGYKIDFDFEKLTHLDCGVEIMKHYHPLFDQIFLDELDIRCNIKTEGVWIQYYDKINIAFNLIKKTNENLYEALQKNLVKIFLYEAEEPFSFATLTAHNMIFLNVPKKATEIFFIEHLAHEGAHVLFNTLTFKSKNSLFKVHYDSLFKDISSVEWEHGTLYSRFHGLFTYNEISKALFGLLNHKDLTREQNIEIKTRLLLILKRFEVQIEAFKDIDYIIEKEGSYWMKIFISTFEKLKYLIPVFYQEVNIENQSYDFDYDIFLKNNDIKMV